MTNPQAEELSDTAESIVAGALLAAADIETVKRLLDIAPAEAFQDHVAAFVVEAAAKLVSDDVLPNPVAVVTWATQQGRTVPVRPPLSGLAKLASDAPMFGSPLQAAREVSQNHHRRRIHAAGRRLAAAAWSDPEDLAQVVDREVATVRAAVVGAGGQASASRQLPQPVCLTDFLAQADDPVRYRIDALLPAGGRVMLSAQFKAGKTTARDNLIRSLADGVPFLGVHATLPARVTLVDNEMDARQLRRWLRDQGIEQTAQVQLVALRGQVAAFDILSPRIRAEWADLLRGTEFLVFDCLRPVLDALGLSEDKDAGRFLVAFDALLREAEISEAVIVHHMGHSGERSRGDSRLRDWPDVEWRITRAGDNPAARRTFSAYGRDVDMPAASLTYDPDTRHLTLTDTTEAEVFRPTTLMEHASRVIEESAVPPSLRQIREAIHGQSKYKDAAVTALVAEGFVTVHKGPRSSRLHTSVRPYRANEDPRSDTFTAGARWTDRTVPETTVDRDCSKAAVAESRSSTATQSRSSHGAVTVDQDQLDLIGETT